MRVVFSEPAGSDLAEIADEIARDSPGRALNFVEEIRGLCLSLGDFPERFRIVRRRPEPHRQAVHGAYRIFYAVRDDHVRIVRVVHSARLIHPEMFA